MAVAALFLAFTPARADSFLVTFIDVTFTAPCYESQSSCSEIVNGSANFDSATFEASNVSLSLTGSLTATLDGWDDGSTNVCYNNSSFCLGSEFFFDLNAANTYNPIEFGPSINNLYAPTPTSLIGGSNGTVLFVPGLCGNDQPNCRTAGDFAFGDFDLTSGSYTSVDQSPEPGTGFLFVISLCAFGILSARRFRSHLLSR